MTSMRLRAAVLTAAVAVGGVGCAGSGEEGATDVDTPVSEPKCAYRVTYEGRSYLDVRGRPGLDREFTVGKDLGTGLLPGCPESGGADGTEKPEKVSVYEVKGIATTIAVAAGETRDEAVLVAVEGADPTSLDGTP
jgi:Family of unknown function (DUF6281)